MEKEQRPPRALFSAPRGKPWVVRKSSRPADWMTSCEVRDAGRIPLRPRRACSPTSEFGLNARSERRGASPFHDLLEAPASRWPVGSQKQEFAGETPALLGIVPRFRGSKREFVRRNLKTAKFTISNAARLSCPHPCSKRHKESPRPPNRRKLSRTQHHS